MPVNQDGVEVNQDGSEITPEQQETSNWTQVVELNQKSIVKPLDIDVLAPNVVPHNIPYLEVYRTDELYAKDYISPFMTAPSSTDTSGEGGSGDSSESSTEQSQEGQSSSTSSTHDTPHSSKTKNQNLKSELLNILKNHYKKTTNFDVLVGRYMSCKTNKLAISIVNGRSANNLKENTDVKSMTNAILKVKKKYS